MQTGRNIVILPPPQPLRPEQVKRLKMRKASEDCACAYEKHSGARVRFCDKHRPTCQGTHGKRR